MILARHDLGQQASRNRCTNDMNHVSGQIAVANAGNSAGSDKYCLASPQVCFATPVGSRYINRCAGVSGQREAQEREEIVVTSFFLAVAAVCGADDAGTATKPRGLHEFPKQISELFKREVQAKSDTTARAAVISEMCELHRQIVSDERFTTSDALKEYRGRLWSRLTKIKTELKQQLARDAKANQEALDDIRVLESADAADLAASDSLASSLSLLDQSQGGPGVLLARGGGAVTEASGRALVELIERTINPAFWDVAGGPGTIMYYAPLQCLVVRATSEIHGHVGALAEDLRAVGP
jgi:hypothetical protein